MIFYIKVDIKVCYGLKNQYFLFFNQENSRLKKNSLV